MIIIVIIILDLNNVRQEPRKEGRQTTLISLGTTPAASSVSTILFKRRRCISTSGSCLSFHMNDKNIINEIKQRLIVYISPTKKGCW